MPRWRLLLPLVALCACSYVPFKRSGEVASSRQTLDAFQVNEILTEAFRRNEKQQGACAYGMDPVTPIDGNRTAIVSYPALKVTRLKSAQQATPRMAGFTPAPAPGTFAPATTPGQGQMPTAAAPAMKPLPTTVDLDLGEVKRIYVGRTDGRCDVRDRLYMVLVAFPWDSLAIEVPPERLIDVLAALTWRKQVEIVYEDDPVD